MSSTQRPINAAGAVLWRNDDDVLRVAVAHRPRYDDWSLPKGKVEAGEGLLTAAMREVAEETGATARVGRRLTTTRYDTSRGPKQVSYWSMQYLHGEHESSDEVDEIAWLTLDEAGSRVSYDGDRSVLLDFAAVPADAGIVLLARHAKAGKRSEWKGEDRLRPLDKIGRRQARDLADVARWFRPTAVAAADRVRCEQTVAPLAEDLSLSVDVRSEFSDEAADANPARALTALRDQAELHGVGVVCSQGGAIPTMLAGLAPAGAPYASRKGSLWVLSLVDGALRAADYYPRPHV